MTKGGKPKGGRPKGGDQRHILPISIRKAPECDTPYISAWPAGKQKNPPRSRYQDPRAGTEECLRRVPQLLINGKRSSAARSPINRLIRPIWSSDYSSGLAPTDAHQFRNRESRDPGAGRRGLGFETRHRRHRPIIIIMRQVRADCPLTSPGNIAEYCTSN